MPNNPFKKNWGFNTDGNPLPKVEIFDRGEQGFLEITIEIADPRMIKTAVGSNQLVIQGIQTAEPGELSGFQEAISLPVDVDPQTTQASFRNNVLTLTIQKLSGHVKAPKKISVKELRQTRVDEAESARRNNDTGS